ncbi:hypothetical protein [Mycolicibacterium mageritense]|uniref:hypothetical protein n=1 Tax=Mycolicibacterium mageritense TaxID=53462 RepID=UPI001E64E096|nr:hypothetical protein [Mycolicibacterium mageritense]MCC9182559.1 hypothetical protein [Mycolicibacterium mageritense]
MAYTRQLRTVVPVLISEHTKERDVMLVWLVRESFEREAASQGLVITEWRDGGDMDPLDVSPQTEREVLKRPATDYRWRMFEGVATREAPSASVD